MSPAARYGDVSVSVDDRFVATVELRRPPDNYFDVALIRDLADSYAAVDRDPAARAILLCAQGKHFCAGADFRARPAAASGSGDDASSPSPTSANEGPAELYAQAARLFDGDTPVVAAVQGAAIGGGLGLACSADFRVAGARARFAANFALLGFHHGFGLTITLPPLVGQQGALDLLYTGRRIDGAEALRLGLCDRLTEDDPRAEAHELAAAIAGAAPLAVVAIRRTMRAGLADRVREATAHELAEQRRLQLTADWGEGVAAAAQRRVPRFEGR